MRCKFTFAAMAIAGTIFVYACGGSEPKSEDKTAASTEQPAQPEAQAEVHGTEVKAGDIKLDHPLNAEWVASGKGIYDMKCMACHKLTDERLVGPGWAGVTKRRQPEWIINMITNVDMMLEKDPEAQKLLEQCLVRMPNQNISQDDARHILEYMRQNDGEK
ncbi:c-type cytochrome [Flavihumibacter petaseus]|nr:c-type cytochrome [Flavihumibacter petaseus]